MSRSRDALPPVAFFGRTGAFFLHNPALHMLHSVLFVQYLCEKMKEHFNIHILFCTHVKNEQRLADRQRWKDPEGHRPRIGLSRFTCRL